VYVCVCVSVCVCCRDEVGTEKGFHDTGCRDGRRWAGGEKTGEGKETMTLCSDRRIASGNVVRSPPGPTSGRRIRMRTR
jgi:hypothetical protein